MEEFTTKCKYIKVEKFILNLNADCDEQTFAKLLQDFSRNGLQARTANKMSIFKSSFAIYLIAGEICKEENILFLLWFAFILGVTSVLQFQLIRL